MKRILFAVIVIVLLAGAGYALLREPENQGWLGWVEADMLYIGAPNTARLSEMTVDEGAKAKRGTVLFALEAQTENAAVETARANLKRANAALSLANAPQDRQEQLEALAASRKEAVAAYDYAEKSLTRAKALYKQQSGTKANLDSAVNAYEKAKAIRNQIDAKIALGRLPQRKQQIAQAEQNVAAAQSELVAAKAALALKTVAAPASGSIEEVYYRTGEVVPAGRPVVSLLPPENIKIRFFVPERERSSLKVGDSVSFSTDGGAQQQATIVFIAKNAEYTPPEIYSREERAKMVYRFEARPNDPEALAVGLPVDVYQEAKR